MRRFNRNADRIASVEEKKRMRPGEDETSDLLNQLSRVLPGDPRLLERSGRQRGRIPKM
jgi:hypothetical protein